VVAPALPFADFAFDLPSDRLLRACREICLELQHTAVFM
jgi:hypothetical protein